MTPYVQNNIFLNSHSPQNVLLKEGQSVFVRVLADNGGGQYTVSFANSRFNVSCQTKLSLGQTFNANVHFGADGKILLEPFSNVASGATLGAGANVGALSSPYGGNGGNANNANFSSLYNMLSAEGFVPDELSARLFLFLQQTGVRIDRTLMAKARSLALRFPGKERQAAEAAALLMEDGIDASEVNVKKVLELFYGDASGDKGRDGQQSDGCHHGHGGQQTDGGQQSGGGHQGHPFGGAGQGGSPFAQESNVPDDDGDSTASVKDVNFLKKIYKGSCGNKAGFLTYLNQVKGSDNHWIFLPYEWKCGEKLFTGIIRILLNLSEKSTKKIEINFKNTVANYDFVLYFSGSKVKEVRFCTLPPLLPSEVKTEELRLGGILSSGMNLKEPVTVTYSDSACIDGICATNEVPSFVEEEI
ncbi:MAG: hypothetical protein J6X67_09315 [Treponema sp.]|nr:hypothetical protein [Treponema sp.]